MKRTDEQSDDRDEIDDLYEMQGNPVGVRRLSTCQIGEHTIGVAYRELEQSSLALRTLGRMATNPTFTELGFGWQAAAALSNAIAIKEQTEA